MNLPSELKLDFSDQLRETRGGHWMRFIPPALCVQTGSNHESQQCVGAYFMQTTYLLKPFFFPLSPIFLFFLKILGE